MIEIFSVGQPGFVIRQVRPAPGQFRYQLLMVIPFLDYDEKMHSRTFIVSTSEVKSVAELNVYNFRGEWDRGYMRLRHHDNSIVLERLLHMEGGVRTIIEPE